MNFSPLLASFGTVLALLAALVVGDEGLSANLTCAKPSAEKESSLQYASGSAGMFRRPPWSLLWKALAMRRGDPLISEIAQVMLDDALGDAICHDELSGCICVRGKLPWEDDDPKGSRPWGAVEDSCGYAYAQEAFVCRSERDFQHALAIVADKHR